MLFLLAAYSQRMVDVVMHREGHRRLDTIDAGAAGIDDVFHAIVAAPFEDLGETDDVAVDIGERVFDGVAHARSGGQIHHQVRLMGGETVLDGLAVGEVDARGCAKTLFGAVNTAKKGNVAPMLRISAIDEMSIRNTRAVTWSLRR